MNSDLGKSTAVCQPWFTTQMDLIPGVGWSDQRWLCKRLESLAHDPQSVREFGASGCSTTARPASTSTR